MLIALMKVTFFSKESELRRDWLGYDARRILRPAFNLGGNLYSGTISSNEKIYYWNKEYDTIVEFFTVDNDETYSKVKPCLCIGKIYCIQMASKIIGKAVLLDYTYV